MSFLAQILGGLAAGIGVVAAEIYFKPILKKFKKKNIWASIKGYFISIFKKLKAWYNNL